MTEREIPLERKLKILADAAKYDVACTSSGSSRRGKKGHLGNTVSAGICHTFSSDGRCVSLLKILFSNDCVFDCKYCPSRAANEKERATFTPEEICRLVVEFYRRNYIEGLFLSSAVVKSPAYTMERMYEAIYMLRNKYHFNGYIHVKAIPGAPDDIIYALGFLVDRMSVNLELPTAVFAGGSACPVAASPCTSYGGGACMPGALGCDSVRLLGSIRSAFGDGARCGPGRCDSYPPGRRSSTRRLRTRRARGGGVGSQ